MSSKIQRALISVHDKTGLVELGRGLHESGVEILSTGGSALVLRSAGIPVIEVSDFTGFPEILDGRVKTLHPKIHGGILAMRHDPKHREVVAKHGLVYIDLVVVNLYPFEGTLGRRDVTAELVIENIDIGGPTLIRAAAKNFRDVTVVVDPGDYEELLGELQAAGGQTRFTTRWRLCRKAFDHTARYDSLIADAMNGRLAAEAGSARLILHPNPIIPARRTLTLTKRHDLRYGENPHQSAGLYTFSGDTKGIADAEQLHGKELSFNNYLDLDAAWNLVTEFAETACVIVKHTNPCGAALGGDLREAYDRALATDPVSAFGGIIATNRTVDEDAATQMSRLFVEAIIAPEFSPAALEILTKKKNIRLMRVGWWEPGMDFEDAIDLKRITGGVLLQSRDRRPSEDVNWSLVTQRPPGSEETRALRFAWVVCKHVKSNAIVYAREGQALGVGAGQMSRVDSVKLGAQRAHLPLTGSVLASDAFFPFRDGIDEAAKAGVTAVVQPGGSMRDAEVISAADEHGMAMVFTGVRHFRH